MRRLMWTWVVGLLVTAPVQGQSPTSQKPRRPWVLEGPNVVTVSPPPSVAAVARPYVDDAFKGVAADLNRDGSEDYILQGHRDECGTGGCLVLDLRRHDDKTNRRRRRQCDRRQG